MEAAPSESATKTASTMFLNIVISSFAAKQKRVRNLRLRSGFGSNIAPSASDMDPGWRSLAIQLQETLEVPC